MDIVKIKEQLKTVFKNFLNNKVNNEDKWITIHPNGEDAKGRPLLLKDGETPREALARAYGVDEAKGQQKLFPTKEFKKTKEDFQREEQEQKDVFAQHQKKLEKKYRNMEFAGTENPDELQDLSGEDIDFEEWEDKKQSDTKDGKDLYSDENFKENAKRLNEQFGEKPYSEWQKDVQTMLKKYGKTEEDWDNAIGARKDAFKQSDSKGNSKDTTDSSFGEGVEIIESDKKGYMLDSKNLKSYRKGDKFAIVDDWSHDNNDRYTVSFHDGKKTLDRKTYSTKRGMEKAIREHLQGGANKETKALETKTNLAEKEQAYKEVLKRYNDNDKKRWSSGLSNAEYSKAWDEAEKAKKELTKARREYAESIMANFEKSDNTYYEDKQNARRERYEELSDKASRESEQAHQAFRNKMSAIPFGQPILVGHHSEQRDRRYREKAWDTLGKAVKLSDKADYYESKANSVGKAGISSDDANAIAKLAQKYKSGVTSAEKRRIIDRVIDIHKNRELAQSSSLQSDYSNLGFQVERNTDINRLQLKFDGKPPENVRSILKSNGFRWSPREGAWQRQLGANSEGSLSRVVEKLNNINNSLLDGLNTILMQEKYSYEDAQIIKKIDEILNPQ